MSYTNHNVNSSRRRYMRIIGLYFREMDRAVIKYYDQNGILLEIIPNLKTYI